jgi:hypothetical protein
MLYMHWCDCPVKVCNRHSRVVDILAFSSAEVHKALFEGVFGFCANSLTLRGDGVAHLGRYHHRGWQVPDKAQSLPLSRARKRSIVPISRG